MSEVKRWHMPRGTSVSEGEDGEFVLASDYDALEAERDKLAQILRDLVPGCKWKHMRPRIDAALAEIDHDNE